MRRNRRTDRRAGATAAILGVDLDDLFRIEATPVQTEEAPPSYLSPEQSQRLADLFGQQAQGDLSDRGRRELDRLVTAYGRGLHERQVRDYSTHHGLPTEEARQEIAARFADAVAWWQAFEQDPDRRRALAAAARRRRRAAPASPEQ